MYPNAADPRVAAVSHDALRRLGSRDYHHAVYPARDRLQVGVTRIALECVHVRIHREYIMPRCLQPLVNQIADRMVTLLARNSRNRDAFLSQKVLHPGFEVCFTHGLSSSYGFEPARSSLRLGLPRRRTDRADVLRRQLRLGI